MLQYDMTHLDHTFAKMLPMIIKWLVGNMSAKSQELKSSGSRILYWLTCVFTVQKMRIHQSICLSHRNDKCPTNRLN